MRQLKLILLLFCFQSICFSQTPIPFSNEKVEYPINFEYEEDSFPHKSQFLFTGDNLDFTGHYLIRENQPKIPVEEGKSKFDLQEDLFKFIKDEKKSKFPMKVVYFLKKETGDTQIATITLNITSTSVDDDDNDGDKSQPLYPTQLTVPHFNYGEIQLESDKRARFLIIDDNPDASHRNNNILYKRNGKNSFKIAKAIPVNSSLSILISNSILTDLEKIKVEIDALDFTYTEGVKDVLDGAKNLISKEDDPNSSQGQSDSEDDEDDESQSLEVKTEKLKNYLTDVSELFKKNKYLHFKELPKLEAYQNKLDESIRYYFNKNNISLDKETRKLIDSIISWKPTLVSITPRNILARDTDEIEIKITETLKNKEIIESIVGAYRIKGGLAVGVNSNIYITGLKNNKVYSDSILVNGTKELRAKMDSEDQLSIGIGMNSELSFRTGSIVKPTINVGFFIPIGEEDLSPFLALGPGFSIGNKKVKFSLSGGWAFGKVNAISERYKDKDLSQFGTIEDGGLTEKVWKSSWQIGIGLSYNLTGN